ncbi:hypothetical protein QUF31_21760 [Dickeya chrysanthemi]|uniref:hypothetical protein n=1 Tax=Dickeya chrysanthemi TaxID=556 RepID=UPI0025A1321E|nr:hypothetical protein [Dickeya chrysanthemi]WJM85555.1 hypothetical protein QUF31_21760 [Dickeya chrysanthemi]
MHGTGLLLGMWLVLACQGSAQAQVSEQTDTTTRVMLRQQLAASCVSVAAAEVA